MTKFKKKLDFGHMFPKKKTIGNLAKGATKARAHDMFCLLTQA